MSRIVADASVIVKWLHPARDDEPDSGNALRLLEHFESGKIALHQPPHWLAEVAAVTARLSPKTAVEDILDLCRMSIPVVATPEVYLTACDLSLDLNHHFFDTLYHAVALHVDRAMLVTADERYYRKARRRGAILRLAEYGRV